MGSYFNFLKAASILINKHNHSDVTVCYNGTAEMSQLVKIGKVVDKMSRVQSRFFIGYPILHTSEELCEVTYSKYRKIQRLEALLTAKDQLK